ncbi:hypothetical protein [Roseateles violae]|uniref:Uncharacterized protein n=1 Tax=Roseateles violae TaxID=3058042 RepID=A0ABT8DT70_9BURK|nr:hypothetical protein [Pelomonas sp. PFR6]MDN3921506.1 hypothetical protein [Pelomonas sp. PFR6]
MALSGSIIGGQVPGLALLGWALFKGATGALVKGSGITVARTAAGTYTLTMAQAMPSTDVIVTTAMQASADNAAAPNFKSTISSATTIALTTSNASGGALTDHPTYYVAVYG